MEWIGCGIVVVWEIGLGYWIFVQSYPERRSYNVAVRVAEVVCLAVLCVLHAWNSNFCFISNLACVSQGIFCGIYLWLYYKCKIGISLSWGVLYSVFMSLIRVPFLVWKGVFYGKNVVEVNLGNKSTINFLYEIIVLMVITLLYERYGRKREKQIRKYMEKYRFFLLVLTAIMWEAMSWSMQSGVAGFYKESLFIFFYNYIGLLFTVLAFIIYLVYQNIKMEKTLLLQQQKVLRRQQLEEKELFDNYERRMHDVKHTFLFIEQCIEAGNYEKALCNIKEAQKNVQGQKIWTGYQNVDFVLNSKQQEIEAFGIELELETEIYEILMDELDFSIILGNLFDNAVEAAMQCEERRRKIKLKIKNANNIFKMVIWNSSNQMPTVEKGTFKTTKGEKELHGWGIKNVCQIVEKYNGEIKFQYDAVSFEVKIILMGGGVS